MIFMLAFFVIVGWIEKWQENVNILKKFLLYNENIKKKKKKKKKEKGYFFSNFNFENFPLFTSFRSDAFISDINTLCYLCFLICCRNKNIFNGPINMIV